MKSTTPDDSVRNWLRQGDPGNDGSEPDALEIASIRRRVLAVADEDRAPAWAQSPLWATAAAILLAAAVGSSLEPTPISPAAGPRPDGSGEVLPASTAPGSRQIQFDTPGGTRVIWVLDPEFKV